MATFNCVNCFNSNPQKIDELFNEIMNQGRKPLLVLILNIILNIEKQYSYYCFCKNQHQCLICATAASFKGVQYGLYQHSHEFNETNLVLVDLCLVLKNLIERDDHFVCSL